MEPLPVQPSAEEQRVQNEELAARLEGFSLVAAYQRGRFDATRETERRLARLLSNIGKIIAQEFWKPKE